VGGRVLQGLVREGTRFCRTPVVAKKGAMKIRGARGTKRDAGPPGTAQGGLGKAVCPLTGGKPKINGGGAPERSDFFQR